MRTAFISVYTWEHCVINYPMWINLVLTLELWPLINLSELSECIKTCLIDGINFEDLCLTFFIYYTSYSISIIPYVLFYPSTNGLMSV